MRILFLTKRQYTNKDLIDDRFGRLRELPVGLAQRGHTVVGLCLSYAARSEGTVDDHDGEAVVTWHSLNAGPVKAFGFIKFFLASYRLSRHFRPDIVAGASDSIYAILAVCLARLTGARSLVDLYDNFESYTAIHISGVRFLFGWALRSADVISCVSHELASMVRSRYRTNSPVKFISNAVRADLFRPRDRLACRERFSLPERAMIVGTAGAISHSRGITVLFDAFRLLAEENPDVWLVFAGPRDTDVVIPQSDRIRYLGVLDAADVPDLLGALDVAVICNRDSEFGRYCFPQKAYEILACGVPLVAADIGVMHSLLSGYPRCLFTVDSPESLAAALRDQLENPCFPPLPIPGWSDLAMELERFLLSQAGQMADKD